MPLYLFRLLPPGVLVIDLKDAGNPQLCSEYVTETFAYLRTIEGQARVKVNHLSGLPTDVKMRAVLVDWLVEVQTQFKLLQETLHSTVNIVDRYVDNFTSCMLYVFPLATWSWKGRQSPEPNSN